MEDEELEEIKNKKAEGKKAQEQLKATLRLALDEEAYERLKVKKENNDSFSDVILRVTNKANLSDFAGILKDKEADEMESRIKESRKRSSERMKRIRKMMQE